MNSYYTYRASLVSTSRLQVTAFCGFLGGGQIPLPLRLNRRGPSAACAAWLVLALCWAQAVGLVHRSLHGPVAVSERVAESAVPPRAIAHADAHAHAHDHAPAHAEDSSVFGHTQHQSAECRLFDQLLLVDLLSAGNPASAPAPVPVGSSADVASGRDAEATSAYWARGPPVIG